MEFEIYKHIAAISKPNNGWTKELNYISWDSREPVYDLRTWNEDHTKMGKGVTITAGGDGEVEGGVGGDEGVLDWREECEGEARI